MFLVLGHCYAPMFLVYLVIGTLQMFFDDDDDDHETDGAQCRSLLQMTDSDSTPWGGLKASLTGCCK